MDSQFPKVSAITICFNSEKTIEQTIKSVVEQKYPNIEYIIVDGGSTDGTISIVNEYIKKFDYIKFKSEPDNGIADAFNKGIKRSTGKIIVLINSDDELYDNAMELAAAIYKETKADVIYGDTIVVDDKNNITVLKKAGDLSAIKYEMPFIHQSCFISKEAYRKWGGYDGQYKICMDYDLISRVYHAGGKFVYAGGILSVFRYGGTSCEHPFKTINEDIRIARKYGLKLIDELPYRFKAFIKNMMKIVLVKIGVWRQLYSIKNRNNIL